MKVCFPVEEDRGLDSTVFDHFGSAPLYLLVDPKSEEVTPVENPNRNHPPGRCNPADSLRGREVSAVVVGGIGPGALSSLISMHMLVYQADGGRVGDNLARLKDGTLPAFTSISACSGDKSITSCCH